MDWLLKPLQFISPFHLIMQNINIINGFVTWTMAIGISCGCQFLLIVLWHQNRMIFIHVQNRIQIQIGAQRVYAVRVRFRTSQPNNTESWLTTIDFQSKYTKYLENSKIFRAQQIVVICPISKQKRNFCCFHPVFIIL